MTLEELINSARSESRDDQGEAYLWSNAEWIRFANDAQREACRRARLIVDSSTPAITQIALNSTDSTYPLDSRIIFIRRAKLSGRSQLLGRISYRELDDRQPGWQDEISEPRGYIPDMDVKKFRPYPRPSVAGNVSLTVIRLPLVEMKDLDDKPEIDIRFHESLVFWMLHRAYSKQDSETLDKTKAADNLAKFEQEFGRKSSAIDETWIEMDHGYTESEGLF